jgi:hypothetical protein
MKLTDIEFRMIDNHSYTLHHTYTGEGCAMCGRFQEEHDPAHGKMVNGEKVPAEWIRKERLQFVSNDTRQFIL